MPLKLPFRQIHLDFHTSIAIGDVGHGWDRRAFIETLDQARVNSVTVFAKCHHGHLYYQTDRPERHPTLPRGLDLLGEQIEVLHERDMQAPIYISVLFDEYAANQHPEWIARRPDGAPVRGGPFIADWSILDMTSPYQEFLAEQIDEVLRTFAPTDGIFLDICFDVQSATPWAIDSMKKAGLDPTDPADRARHARQVTRNYMTRFKRMVDQAHKGNPCKIWFNSRPKALLGEEKKYLRHVEIEALPTGGWGYSYFPLNVRFARNFGLPVIGMTARFHKSWADFGGLKPQAALMYECCQMLAHGAGCSIGDQLHPRGTLDPAAYELIGSVYRHVEACEPWCEDAKPVTEAAVIRPVDGPYHVEPGGTEEGVVRALQQLHVQFDFIPPGHKLDDYALIIVPEHVRIDAELAAKLKARVDGGAAMLVCGEALLDPAGESAEPVLDRLGIHIDGPSDYGTTYMRLLPELTGADPKTDPVMYERGLQLRPRRGSEGLARIVEPYFERSWEHFCSHAQTPTDKPGNAWCVVGSGRTISIAYPIFKAFATHGNIAYRDLLGHCIDRLLPHRLIQTEAPSHVEMTLMRKRRQHIVHVLSFAPQRRTPTLDIVEEATPLRHLPLAIHRDSKPRRVYTAPYERELEYEYRDGYVHISLSTDDGHVMVVIE